MPGTSFDRSMLPKACQSSKPVKAQSLSKLKACQSSKPVKALQSKALKALKASKPQSSYAQSFYGHFLLINDSMCTIKAYDFNIASLSIFFF